MDVLNPANVLLFTNAHEGGREANDANNSTREHMILALLTRDPAIPYNNEEYGQRWRNLRDSLYLVINQVFGNGTTDIMKARLRGGRRFNWDFDLEIRNAIKKLELKVGHGTNVDNLPEFFNPGANYDIHDGNFYANYFYDNYLMRVLNIYPGFNGEMLTRDQYMRRVHGTSRAPALFSYLYNAEANGTADQKIQKRALVNESISNWLNMVSHNTDIRSLSEALKRSQEDKTFLLFDRDTQRFYADSISNEELTIRNIIGVRNGNTLVLQSNLITTTIHMLLRWKNHAGILYPAWQISMRR